jgi:hypothetical protein
MVRSADLLSGTSTCSSRARADARRRYSAVAEGSLIMMAFFRRLRARIRYRHFDAELRQELDVHRAMAEDDFRARGAAPDEAPLPGGTASGEHLGGA